MKQRPILLAAGSIGLALVLLASLVAGWQYLNFVPPFTLRLSPGPSPNGYLAAERAALVLQAAGPSTRMPPPFNGAPPAHRPLSQWPDGPPAEVRARLARIEPVLDQVRAQFRYPWSAEPDLRDPNLGAPLSGFRECARGFVAESNLRREAADDPGAMRSALDAVELGARMARGGSVLHRLVALAVHAIGFRAAERLALQLPSSAVPSSLSRVRRLRGEWPSLAETLEGERAFTRAAMTREFRRFRQMSPAQQWKDLSSSGNLGAVETLRALLTPRRTAIADVDDYYRRLIAESRKPVRQRRPLPASEDYWVGVVMGIDPLDQPWLFDRARTELALLEVALAVRMHYLQHGRYPAHLTDISKQWLPAVPTDLWDQPIAFRLKNGQPIIYSLGPDGKDDGGLPIDATRLTPTTRGDLVFGLMSHRLHRR